MARLPRYERWLLEDEERLLVGYRWMASIQLRCGGPVDVLAALEAARLCALRSSLSKWLYAGERSRLDCLSPSPVAGADADGEAHARSTALDERMGLELLDRLAAVRPEEYLTEEVLWSQLEPTDRLLIFALSDAAYAVLVIGRSGVLRTFQSARVRSLERALFALRQKTNNRTNGSPLFDTEMRAKSNGAATRRDEYFETRAFRVLDPSVRDRLIPRAFQLTIRDCAFPCSTQNTPSGSGGPAEAEAEEEECLTPERLLYRLLITPVEELLADASRLLLVPDGALARNAELLNLLQDAESGRRLADRWRCTIVPSLYLLAKLFRSAQIAADLVAARETRLRAEITAQAEPTSSRASLSRASNTTKNSTAVGEPKAQEASPATKKSSTSTSTSTGSSKSTAKSTKAAMPHQYTHNAHTTVTTRTATGTTILAADCDIPRFAQVPALGRVLLIGSCEYMSLVTRTSSPRDRATGADGKEHEDDVVLPPSDEPPVYMPFRMEQRARAAEPALRTQPATARTSDPVVPVAPPVTSRSALSRGSATPKSGRMPATSRDTGRDSATERSENALATKKKSREVEAPLAAFGLPDGRCWKPIGNLPEALDELKTVRNVLLGRSSIDPLIPAPMPHSKSVQHVGTSRKSTATTTTSQQQQNQYKEEAHLRVVSGRAATKVHSFSPNIYIRAGRLHPLLYFSTSR